MESRSRGLRELCRLLGYTSQAYYQYQSGLRERAFREEQLIQQVLFYRRLQPRLGARKLLLMLQPLIAEHQLAIGRDAFFELLRLAGLLVRKRRRSRPRTTFSVRWFNRYPDLVKGLTVSRPDELWVSDITYIHLQKGFAYLSLVTDAYSRKIIGFCLSHDLSTDSCLSALRMALASRTTSLPLIHHSDRGTQYCSLAYTALLGDHHIRISMTQSGNPRDNAIAERVNGIIKQELLNPVYLNYRTAQKAVTEAIDTYNRLRPHSSVDMLTPEKAHSQTGEIRRRWKSYFKTAAKEVIMDG